MISALIGTQRTGKSFLLRQAAAEVAAAGMPAERVHFSRLAHEPPGAVFIDEVQENAEWARSLVGTPTSMSTSPRSARALTGKVVLSLDPLPLALPDGLRHVDLRRFLAGERLHPGGWA